MINKFFNRYPGIFLVLVLLLLYLVVQIILKNDPFSPVIWGTVTDWLMVVVTGITGILIWLTLKSQTKVQEIEQKRFALELKPKFKVEKRRINTSRIDLHIILEERIPTKVRYEYKNIDSNIINLSDASALAIGSWQPGLKIFLSIELKSPMRDYAMATALHLYYYDELGLNKYRMSFPILVPPLTEIGKDFKQIVEAEGPFLIN